MVRHAFALLIAAAAVLSVCGFNPQPAQAQGPVGQADVFYNYYVPPGSPAGVAAAMYPCPRPTPPLVGHTYVTYAPLLPQQFLYNHQLSYCTCNCDGSMTRTTVRYNHLHNCWPFEPTVMWGVATPHTPPAKAPSVSCMH
jgi:hypothetical protein